MLSHNADRIPFPSGFWAGVGQLGIDAHDIVRKAQLPIAVIAEQAVTTAQYFAIWQAYSDLVGDMAKGIVGLAAAFDTAKYPPTVLATYHASDYRDALSRMVRYKQMCPPESLRMIEEGDRCTIELEWKHPELSGPPILTGITLAFLLELGRRGTGKPLKARSIEFTHPMGNVQALENYFGCRIQTGRPSDRLTLHRRDLDHYFISSNEELMEVLTPVLDRTLEERLLSRSFAETVKIMIKRNLTGGCPVIQVVAKELGMSDRTLQRRLTEENTSFKHLLNQARHEQARAFLADPSLPIKVVASLIGYEDQNSFYRAFRQWEGETPFKWRAAHMDANFGA